MGKYRKTIAAAVGAAIGFALPAMATPGSGTAWLSPVPGSFDDPSRWTAGVPSLGITAGFGLGAGVTPFVVDVTGVRSFAAFNIGGGNFDVDIAIRGPELERLAEGGDPTAFELPRMLLGRKDCDFSFSGLKTAAARLAQTCETDQQRADLADAVQTAIARQLAERSDRALKAYAEEHPRRLFVVAGGVAANRTVRATLQATAEKNGFAFLAPPMAYCTDNAARIALAGAERLRKGLVSDIDTAARPRWPLDEYSALNDPTHAPGRKGAKA